jgi:hypothetical protein
MNETVRGLAPSGGGDPWKAFDALPAPIRVACWGGVSSVCPLKVRRLWQAERKRGGTEAEAIARTVRRIETAQESQIAPLCRRTRRQARSCSRVDARPVSARRAPRSSAPAGW